MIPRWLTAVIDHGAALLELADAYTALDTMRETLARQGRELLLATRQRDTALGDLMRSEMDLREMTAEPAYLRRVIVALRSNLVVADQFAAEAVDTAQREREQAEARVGHWKRIARLVSKRRAFNREMWSAHVRRTRVTLERLAAEQAAHRVTRESLDEYRGLSRGGKDIV